MQRTSSIRLRGAPGTQQFRTTIKPLLAFSLMAAGDWIPHRRGDGEFVGWMIPRDDGFVVVDLLGHERTNPIDWLAAEAFLDELGIGYLAEMYVLTLEDGRDLRVRMAEASPDNIRVKKDDWGAVGAPQIYYDLGFPAPATLRLLNPSEVGQLSPELFED